MSPSPIRIGEGLTGNWTAEGVRGRTQTTVVEARRVKVEGRDVDCYLVDRRTTLSGDVEGEQRQRTCWAPSLGMAATDDLEVAGTYRGIPFTGTVRLSLIASPQDGGASVGEGSSRAEHRWNLAASARPRPQADQERRRIAMPDAERRIASRRSHRSQNLATVLPR